MDRPPLTEWFGSRAGQLGGGALALSFLGLIEPAARVLLLVGMVAAAANAWLAHHRSPRTFALWPTLSFAVSAGWGTLVWLGPSFKRGDSWDYFWYLPSALNGSLARQALNLHPVGPACIWAPAFAVAHLYVRLRALLGIGGYAANGWSEPYLFAAAGTTVAVAVVGAAMLMRALAREHGWPTATVSVLGLTLASPIPVYVFYQPLMSHGVVFGLSCALAAIWLRAWVEPECPTARTWFVLGALLGLLVLVRAQAAVCGLPLVALAVRDIVMRRTVPRWPLLGAAACALCILPQLLAWRALRGVWLTIPQGHGFLDWSASHLWEVLLSADHGLLTWTPVACFAILGWTLRPRSAVTWLSAAVLFATAWINGAVLDWWGADAYGARRFDLTWPFLAIGMTILVARAAELVRRNPLIAPAALLGGLVLWNFGMIRSYHGGRFLRAAPLDEVAASQAQQLHALAESVGTSLAGPRGRNLVYSIFVGEYLGTQTNIDMGAVDVPALASGWSEPGRGLRRTVPPTSCVRLPLGEARDMRITVVARAAQPQLVALRIDGVEMGRAFVGENWTQLEFEVPGGAFFAGPNSGCLDTVSPVAVREISVTLLRMGKWPPRAASTKSFPVAAATPGER